MEFVSRHNEQRDWAELIPEMLHLVSKKLPELSDFVQFRAVCKPWRSATPTNDPPSYLPWLLSQSSSSSNKELCFYSLSSKKFHMIHVDESYGKELMGPAQNYIFSTDPTQSSPTFLNPLVGKHICLPPLKLDWCFPISNGDDRDCVAICGGKIDTEYQTLSFCRPGDEKWMQIQKSLEGCLMIYFEGTYVVYNPLNGETEIIDVMTGDVLSVMSAPPKKLNYLVESSGEILGVSCLAEHGCEIYRVNRSSHNWVKMSDIDDRILFLHGGQGFSVRARESDQFKGNCVYHLGHNELVKVDGTCTTYHLFRYKIDDKIWEELSLPLMEKPTWFLPSLH